MCGIAGIFSFSGAPAEQREVEKMTDAIAHRGPDGQGVFLGENVALGHRRLSIIDLETGSQPMRSASGRTTIVFNGEIYNYPELRADLAKRGCVFKTQSDTEVILALYEAEGEAGVEKLAGMFAFALWDAPRRRLLLAHDRAGMKPLYYAVRGGRLFFASEIKAIRAACPEVEEPDLSAVNFYFSRQYVGGEGTFFQEIKKVKPGACLTVGGDGRIFEKTYWRLEPRPAPKLGMAEAAEQTGILLEAAVRSHLIADVPVGVFLSGGLDSSAVLACAAASGQDLQTFTVGFGENSALNETHFARKLALHFGTAHHEIHVTEREVLDCLPHVVRHLDEPLADYAALPTYVMSRFAARQVKVVLSGEGADELFGGYKRYHRYALLDRLPGGCGFAKKWLPSPCVFEPAERRKLLQPGVFIQDSLLPQELKMQNDKARFFPAGHVNSILHADLSNWLADDLLVKVDRMGMLASLEARVPYLDHALVEQVACLDGRLKVGLREKKRLLRAVAAKRLPPEVFNRPKHGFTVPVEAWLRGALRETFEEVVFKHPENERWLDLRFVRRLFGEHLAGRSHRLQLWAVLVFCWWRLECFEKAQGA